MKLAKSVKRVSPKSETGEKKNETEWNTVKSFMKENFRHKIIDIEHDFDVKEPKIYD